MALNLISSYGSEDDSDASDVGRSVHDSDVELPQPSEPTKNSFFFGEADGSGSDDDSMGPSKNVDNTQNKPSGGVRRLPSAGSVLRGKHVGSSVFSSEREREDLAHVLTLSQHVPLTEKVETKKKPLCRAFARGECRRGAKCRYAHPITPVAPQDAVTIDAGPRMYDADDVFTKKPKIA
ncbi:C3H1-type domain-containing protein [Trichostrongylus colubriformis]|uniref:C3H1-type domain-containing protein n=1 Tax=Trichostrongylus colubriformis TaxID=6319 RepID=A0AAN8IYH8_TRICO